MMAKSKGYPTFLRDGGVTGKLFNSIDWTESPIGIPEAWPDSLKTSLKILFNSRHPMFIWWGPELIQFYNDAYLPSFGKGKHPAAMGQKGKECWPEIWPIIWPQIEGVMNRGTATWHEDQLVPIFRNDTIEDCYWTYGYSPIFKENGKIGGVFVVCTETTTKIIAEINLRQSEKDLIAAIKSRDTFLGIASHELNTPLTSIKLETQMGQRILEKQGLGAFPQDKLKTFIENILYQTERLRRLVNDMLDVSRISSGKLTMSIEKGNLSRLVREVLHRFTHQFEGAGCQLKMEITPNILALFDPSRIEQVLTNFITNAVKYAPEKPVNACVERVGSVARVSIQDRGPGIAPENQERIFGRFERGTPADTVSGLGLGLYICKQIIDLHGGKIYVESYPGEGSKFSFELASF